MAEKETALMGVKKESLADKFAPACNLMSVMMVVGCLADIYFTYHFKWDAVWFGAVFTGILVPSKAAKTFDTYMTSKGKK